MKFQMAQINWVDFLTVLVLIVGVVRGRRRGFSQEFLDLMQWVLIIVACGFLYLRGGQWLASHKIFSLLTCYVASYLVIAVVIKLVFSFIKRRVGGKLVEKNFFGGGEYYLGMVSGAVRFACVFLFVLSLLHAPYYSPEQLATAAKFQQRNFGDISFPTLASMQQEVYKNSFTGQAVDRYLGAVLITPTAGTPSDIRSDGSMGKRKEREIDAVMGRK